MQITAMGSAEDDGDKRRRGKTQTRLGCEEAARKKNNRVACNAPKDATLL
jgi:hypothetical protein